VSTLGSQKVERDAAIDAFEVSLRLAPNNADVLEAFALVRQERGEYEAAISLYDRALALDPHSQAQLRRTQSLYRSGRVDEAVSEYKRIGVLYPDVPWKAGIAQIEYDRGHLHHGILWAENNPDVFFVPFAWASLGDKDKVRESYENLRRVGGSFADLMIVEEMFLARNYSGIASWFADSGNIVNFLHYFEMFHPWIAAVYLRDWQEAENKLELWLDEFPKDREYLWGSPAAREIGTDVPVQRVFEHAMTGIYVAYTLDQVGRTADAATVQRWSENVLNTWVAGLPKFEFALLHTRALLAAARGQTEEALVALEALVNVGWRHTMTVGLYFRRDDAYAGDLVWFEDSPLLDSIRHEPRFKAVVDRVNAANATMLAELNAGLTLEDIMDEDVD
jgi:tetratricopeptide (TPR) repeat protein